MNNILYIVNNKKNLTIKGIINKFRTVKSIKEKCIWKKSLC